jgi:hypothetical protein
MPMTPTTTDAVYDEDRSDDVASTRLHLSGVDTPIVTRVTRQSGRGMTVEQSLPFLRLQTQVWDESAKSSRIESVRVVVQDGMPRLVLDLAFDDVDESAPERPSTASHKAHRGVVRPRAPREETVPFEAHLTAAEVALLRPRTQVSAAPARREPTEVFRTSAPAGATAKAAPLPAEVAGLTLSVMEQELLKPRDLAFRARSAWERVQPHVQVAWMHAHRIALRAAERGVPLAKRAGVWTRVFLVQRVWPALRAGIAHIRARVAARRAAAS